MFCETPITYIDASLCIQKYPIFSRFLTNITFILIHNYKDVISFIIKGFWGFGDTLCVVKETTSAYGTGEGIALPATKPMK